MRGLSLIAGGLFLLLCAAPSHGAVTDQHSVEAIQQAIASPIPDSAVQEARKYDDQLLQTGHWSGTKVYLVTDERVQHAQQLAQRLLRAIGEDPVAWVVRILDTDPKIANAFVVGGKYVYIFTGLIDEAKSDDELAVVVGHELGHSILKHNLRRQEDFSSTLANLAVIVAVALKGESQRTAMGVAQSLHNSYSQIDEREADTFGVIASWRAGFDPLRGADFFSRIQRQQDQADAERDKALQEYGSAAEASKAECEARRQQWANGQIAQTERNANAIDERCAVADQQVDRYNQALAQAQSEAQSRSAGDHPDPQERIASIAAVTDYARGVRPIESLGSHVQAQRVVTALLRSDSAILKKPAVVPGHTESGAVAHATADDIAGKLQKLKDMYEKGLIDKPDYEKKKQELLDQL